jgi:hypothetical protein
MEDDFLESQREAQAGPYVSDRAAREALGLNVPSRQSQSPANGGVAPHAEQQQMLCSSPQYFSDQWPGPEKAHAAFCASVESTKKKRRATPAAEKRATPAAEVLCLGEAIRMDQERELEPVVEDLPPPVAASAAEVAASAAQPTRPDPACLAMTVKAPPAHLGAPPWRRAKATTSSSVAVGYIPSQHWATAEPKPSGPPAKAIANNRHVTFSAPETPPAGVPQLCLVNTSRIATSSSAAQAAASSQPGQGGGLEGPSKGTLAVGSRGKEADPSKDKGYYGNIQPVIPYAWVHSDGWQPHQADPSKDEGYYGNIQPVIPYAWVHSDGWQPHPPPPPPGRVEGNRLAAASADLQQ